ASMRSLGAAVFAGAATLVLLFPWSLSIKDAFTDPAAFGIAFHPQLSLDDILTFHTGPSGSGVAMWGLFAPALFALLVAAGPRLAGAAGGGGPVARWFRAVVLAGRPC